MALITCKECGGQMSDRATECPHCGCPIEFQNEESNRPQKDQPQKSKPSKSRKGLWITLAVIGIIAVITGTFLLFGDNIFGKSTLKITPEFTKALERYDQIDAFSEGLAAVRRDGKWGYINLKGEEVIPCQFSDNFPPGQFSEGLACVVDDRNEADKNLWNKRVGFINKNGEWVLSGDYFTESPNIGSVWDEYSHKLPSFKEGKCAVWSSATHETFDDNDIILVDTQGNTHEVSDSIGYKMMQFRPFLCPVPYKDIASTREKKIVYDDYAVTVARDTTECDNGARLVTWQILDANSYPYQTEEKTIQYFIDKKGNSTLTPSRQEAMEQHLNGLMASLLDKHNEQLRKQAEEERRRQEEEERQRIEWVYGTWEYSYTVNRGVYLGGVKSESSKLIITKDNLTVYFNGHLSYNGYYEIENDQIVYDRHNGMAMVINLDLSSHRIEFGNNRFYNKVSSSYSGDNQSNSYQRSSGSYSNTSFRTEADVWAYLSDHTFKGNGTSFRISQRYISINGTPATGAVRVSNISGSTATLSASSPYLGGQMIIMYLNASNGTLRSDGLTYYAQ